MNTAIIANKAIKQILWNISEGKLNRIENTFDNWEIRIVGNTRGYACLGILWKIN